MLITLHYNYISTTLQLQIQLRYTTLHPAVVGEVTAATIATTPKSATPATFRSISGSALPSMHHSDPPLQLPPPPCAALLVHTVSIIHPHIMMVHFAHIDWGFRTSHFRPTRRHGGEPDGPGWPQCMLIFWDVLLMVQWGGSGSLTGAKYSLFLGLR